MPETAAPLLVVRRPAEPVPDRAPLVRRARLLALLGLAWHLVEAAVAIGAGVVASSVALVGFGADSLVEAVAGVVVPWRFTDARAASGEAERRAQRLIGASFYAIALLRHSSRPRCSSACSRTRYSAGGGPIRSLR